MFYGQPRYDHVLLATEIGDIFAKLLIMFSFTVAGTEHPFIMVRPLNGAVMIQGKDKDLGFYRLSAGNVMDCTLSTNAFLDLITDEENLQ